MNGRSSSETAVPSLRSRLREATDAAILTAAEHVFAEQGLHNARMNDIASHAGVAVGTLYNHFKDRDALLAELMDARVGELLSRMDAALAGEGDFRARLTAVMRAKLDYYAEHRPFFYIFQQGELAGRAGTHYPVAGQKLPQILHDVHARLEKLIKRGLKEKALRPEGADLYPAIIIGLMRAVMIREKLHGVGAPIDASQLARCFLDGAGHR